MNLLLLTSEQRESDSTAFRIEGRQFTHLKKVLRAKLGQVVQVGFLNGSMGTATLVKWESDYAVLTATFDMPPPSPSPITLVLGLPRPIMLQRVIQSMTSMGIKRVVLLHTARVEKSYWSSPKVGLEQLHQSLILGLEQGKDTVLPEILIRKKFRPFVEDELPELLRNKTGLVAHPGVSEACPASVTEPTLLALGPEGGFIPFEVDLMAQQGMRPVHFGPRILRVDTAVPAILARLSPL